MRIAIITLLGILSVLPAYAGQIVAEAVEAIDANSLIIRRINGQIIAFDIAGIKAPSPDAKNYQSGREALWNLVKGQKLIIYTQSAYRTEKLTGSININGRDIGNEMVLAGYATAGFEAPASKITSIENIQAKPEPNVEAFQSYEPDRGSPSSNAFTTARQKALTSKPKPKTQKTKPPTNLQLSGRYFSSCREARMAGAAPLRLGDPGYSTRLDRDKDGIACE